MFSTNEIHLLLQLRLKWNHSIDQYNYLNNYLLVCGTSSMYHQYYESLWLVVKGFREMEVYQILLVYHHNNYLVFFLLDLDYNKL